MLKKIFIIILALNIVTYIWHSALSLVLSIQGEILTQRLMAVDSLKNEIDSLEYKILKQTSLENASEFAQKNRFVSISFSRFPADSLADAKNQTSL